MNSAGAFGHSATPQLSCATNDGWKRKLQLSSLDVSSVSAATPHLDEDILVIIIRKVQLVFIFGNALPAFGYVACGRAKPTTLSSIECDTPFFNINRTVAIDVHKA